MIGGDAGVVSSCRVAFSASLAASRARANYARASPRRSPSNAQGGGVGGEGAEPLALARRHGPGTQPGEAVDVDADDAEQVGGLCGVVALGVASRHLRQRVEQRGVHAARGAQRRGQALQRLVGHHDGGADVGGEL